MNNEWLQNLKPGDKVISRSTALGAMDTIETVDRVTPSQVIVRGSKYWRKNGEIVGNKSSWNSHWIAEATPETIEKVEIAFKRLRLTRLLDGTRWRDLPTETLETVAELLPKPESNK